ncbi:MAG: IgGFc-binding protein [Patescibacteria group bacterium]
MHIHQYITNGYIALLLIVLNACQGVQQNYGPHDTETNADAAPDTDTDADADSDADSESETVDTDFTSEAIPTTCAEAAEQQTSVGCEFFAADLDNASQNDHMTYAIVVSNPQEVQSAQITLWDGTESAIYTATLAPGELHVIDVACDLGCLVPPHEIDKQGFSRGAGFRLASDVPILVYQWNTYGIDEASVDASLLLPTVSLGRSYIVAAWGQGNSINMPTSVSQVTVVAIEDDTHVSFIPSTDVPDFGDAGPYGAGVETEPVRLDAFDIIALGPAILDDDVTGTVVRSDKPVVVFGGHACATVPDVYYQACDHLEEQLFPLSAWGTSSVLARHAPRQNCMYEDLVVWRVIAGADDMAVTFDPPAPDPAGSAYYFEKQGDVLEFMASDNYYAEGLFESPADPTEPEAPFLAYQLMTGADYPDCFLNETRREGDPMMLQAAPAWQYLDRYVFNTDNVFDFAYDRITIVRPTGAHVVLDCLGLIPDSQFTAVGSSGWEVAYVVIDDPDNTTGCEDGAHVLTASAPVGLSVVGTGDGVSYGYMGGTGVAPINPVVVE